MPTDIYIYIYRILYIHIYRRYVKTGSGITTKGGVRTIIIIITAGARRGSEKVKSSKNDKYAHGRKKRRPSTRCWGKKYIKNNRWMSAQKVYEDPFGHQQKQNARWMPAQAEALSKNDQNYIFLPMVMPIWRSPVLDLVKRFAHVKFQPDWFWKW